MALDLAKEEVFWTRAMTLRLVKFIKSKPTIWNRKHSKYSSIMHRDQIYRQFAFIYGNNKFTGEDVKDQWIRIRTTFVGLMKRLKASKAKGETYNITWYLWDACSFLYKKDPPKGNDRKIKKEQGNASDNVDATCHNVANGLVNAIRGTQNDVCYGDDTKYSNLTRYVAGKLYQMSSYDAARISCKMLDFLNLEMNEVISI
ncbi:uncharacterized protein LOC113500172 [Trichoplusia ni]|uniref:Uncharacterized protein LOC113499920 n=1 Tax=Trichoplusia ni TaxID=7111 RepID=A0A7E5W853_TRINI|nr:uncharacterized protein LOC113499920 [Trichoplusia ni]XP_026736677.1 uncharacterized protein LOC113500172 [Trichoplusia ni]